jgi:hypothetical protein
MPTKRQAGWPTLEEQLAKDHVVAGSALDKVVRENQDLSLLPPEELNDHFHLPPWMRVYWRRHHPEMKEGEFYPLAIKSLYEWMVQYPDLPGVTVENRKDPKHKGGRHAK